MNPVSRLLRGKNAEAQQRLDQLCTSIGEDPNLLWYPSAGDDYRDIMEFSPVKAAQNGLRVLPDLFIHTDYKPDWLQTYRVIHKEQFLPVEGQRNFSENGDAQQGIAYHDSRTTVYIEAAHELVFRNPRAVSYHVNPAFVDFPESANPEPEVYLLDVRVESARLGVFRKPVLYCFFENVNFLENVLLKHHLKISHLLKVREGCGFGGNRKSISLSYAFLSALRTRYLVVDGEVHFDENLKERIRRRHRLLLEPVRLERRGQVRCWSDFGRINVFEVLPWEGLLVDRHLDRLLEQVQA